MSDTAGRDSSAEASGPSSDLEARVAALERRIDELEAAAHSTDAAPSPHTIDTDTTSQDGPSTGGAAPSTGGDDPFWALNGLIDRFGDDGGVTYTGHTIPPGATSPVSWQMGLTSAGLGELDFAQAAPLLAALGHPVRLQLLQTIFEGTSTVAELGEDERFGTTGQIYHHVHALAGAGWLENAPRGRWRVPAQKVVPLLTLILIATH